jgi:acetyl-CoA C-acetyltransferase
MKTKDIVICHPVRTPIGTYGGSLKDIAATELGKLAITASLERAGIAKDKIQSLVMGNVIQAGNGMNPARQAGMGAALPVVVPALTINRVCGSGAQAIASAFQEIAAGFIDCAIAGGMENMDRAPYLMPAARWGARMGDVSLIDSMLHDGLHDAFSGKHAGWHAEDLVNRYGVSREEQDRWALHSQQRFAASQKAGYFDAELVHVSVTARKGSSLFTRDEHNRPETTRESLSRLQPAFRPDGTITAGNSPGLNAGAAAMIVADRHWAEANGLEPMAKIVSYGISAVEPEYFGLGPVPAVGQALQRAGWKTSDVDRIEINEAFAAIALVCLQELGFPEAIVNPDGGAVAHGHPIGATGAILTVRLLHAMARENQRRGLVTLCIGGGQGIAVALELL